MPAIQRNMDPKKCPMPSQDPNVRNKNFKEVALGYTADMAVNEAKRCLQCKNHPCRTGCPVDIDIPGFIAKVAEGDFEAAYQILSASSALPAVCGRVCPQENQCEGKCIRGIKGEPVGIGRLERFVADWHRENVHTPVTPPAPQRPQGGGDRRGPLRPDRRRRPGQDGLQGHGVRGPACGGRRANVRHPRVPSAQGHRPERD